MRRREGSRSLADGARFLSELIAWGKKNGIAGIRPWAPELDWAMPWFDFDEKTKDITGAVVVYCRSGRRSREAGLKLAGDNCLVLNMDGGILAWQKAGMPVTKE